MQDGVKALDEKEILYYVSETFNEGIISLKAKGRFMVGNPSNQAELTLAKLEMAPNLPVQIRINVGGQAKNLQGEYLGSQHYDFFMVRIQSFPGVLNLLFPQMIIDIRFQEFGSIQSFRTELVSHATRPALILFLKYPERMSIVRLRKSPRWQCGLPVVIQTPEGDAKGIITDIGQGGCQLCFSLVGNSKLKNVEKDSGIVLQTQFSVEGTPEVCTASIKKIETRGTQLSMGIAFVDVPSDFATSLSEYCLFVKEISS